MTDWKFIKFFGLILLIWMGVAGLFIVNSAYYDCPSSCFNKDGELWCEMECWTLMRIFKTTPSVDGILTECESYPNLRWCQDD